MRASLGAVGRGEGGLLIAASGRRRAAAEGHADTTGCVLSRSVWPTRLHVMVECLVFLLQPFLMKENKWEYLCSHF